MKLKTLLLISTLMISSIAHANWFLDIINTINYQSGITNSLLGTSLSSQQEMLARQREINELMKEVNGNLMGHSGWGTYQFHDYQSYGRGGDNWSNVIGMAQDGQGSGQLGQMIGSMAKQFPADRNGFNKGVRNSHSQIYYALKAQTILATRAASELDYNKIQDQIAYQHMLQQQIEQTKDIKAAMDLSNRIQVENNLINLQILRQVALSNQQRAINEQATVNTALFNAKFLTRE